MGSEATVLLGCISLIIVALTVRAMRSRMKPPVVDHDQMEPPYYPYGCDDTLSIRTLPIYTGRTDCPPPYTLMDRAAAAYRAANDPRSETLNADNWSSRTEVDGPTLVLSVVDLPYEEQPWPAAQSQAVIPTSDSPITVHQPPTNPPSPASTRPAHETQIQPEMSSVMHLYPLSPYSPPPDIENQTAALEITTTS
ncbi:uncharacterized protein EV422DRAFT_318257 [Fimicolochytrium jonesii]|uniref:uncharacterized protein n=1 Tax=Fimicolochytrium jonesii TaxID=1396493 RepID=UPI0022FE0BD7|nr:uncharacterized protein EV422DRAFT_318257 [Fimicolochytrium jonesii]KAI8824372.1 hypothetical protein EV422DRAFT_318257 [Fimicolochytrium jonesii]